LIIYATTENIAHQPPANSLLKKILAWKILRGPKGQPASNKKFFLFLNAVSEAERIENKRFLIAE
jgi:hypothetical protein